VALVQSLCTRDKLEVATGRYIAAQSTRQLSWLQVVLSSNATYTENLAVLDIAHNSSLNQSLKIDPRPHYCGHYHMRDVFGAHHHLHGQSIHYWRPNSPRCDQKQHHIHRFDRHNYRRSFRQPIQSLAYATPGTPRGLESASTGKA
jgi:hypothetical protein